SNCVWLLGPQQRDIPYMVDRQKLVHALVQHAMAALRRVPQQQCASFVERNEADMEIVEVRAPRHKPDNVATVELAFACEKSGTRNDTHRKSPLAENIL